MDQSIINQINLIKATKLAIKKSKSRMYKRDALRYLQRLYKQLQDYCEYRGIDYKEIKKEIDNDKWI